jgi:hypothetical protein
MEDGGAAREILCHPANREPSFDAAVLESAIGWGRREGRRCTSWRARGITCHPGNREPSLTARSLTNAIGFERRDEGRWARGEGRARHCRRPVPRPANARQDGRVNRKRSRVYPIRGSHANDKSAIRNHESAIAVRPEISESGAQGCGGRERQTRKKESRSWGQTSLEHLAQYPGEGYRSARSKGIASPAAVQPLNHRIARFLGRLHPSDVPTSDASAYIDGFDELLR